MIYLWRSTKELPIELNWRWDSEITNTLKFEIKESMLKYFSQFHKPLFKYLSDIKGRS